MKEQDTDIQEQNVNNLDDSIENINSHNENSPDQTNEDSENESDEPELEVDKASEQVIESNHSSNESDIYKNEELAQLLQEIKKQLTMKELHESEKIDNLQNELLSLKEMQEKITEDFNEKLKYDDHKEQLIDQLHKELQEYKADVLKSTITPIVNDLIMVSDNIHKLVGNYRSTEEALDGEEILAHLESVTLDIDNVLFRQGIEPYQCLGEKIEPLKQTISKTVKTSDESEVKKIAERLRKGYEWDDKIIRKEHVSVYVYDENMEVTENNKDEGANNNE
ncbi:MAG TPA: nucleotide exchange factor GrpE [Pseudogracilibacillus sp.]|nr:nucleotide exchange factor GrpE [Pseudogracilibacillus sp.]